MGVWEPTVLKFDDGKIVVESTIPFLNVVKQSFQFLVENAANQHGIWLETWRCCCSDLRPILVKSESDEVGGRAKSHHTIRAIIHHSPLVLSGTSGHGR